MHQENCKNFLDSLTNKNIIATFSYHLKKMSTSSTATASDRDPVPTDDPTLKAWMCIFIVMCKDGTPFEVASIMEEDIVQFCMTLGHIHPLGVLQYSATESVALFHMAQEMQWASRGATKVTELHNEPIAIKIIAPTEPHIRAYITIGEVTPLNHIICPQRKRMTQIHQLVTLTGVGVHCNASRQSLETSWTRNCSNL